jgi:hypothetical protein
MDSFSMMRTAVVLLGIAALGGVLMAGIRFARDGQPPAWLAMLHGFLVASALTLLIYAAATVGVPGLAMAAIVLFVLAGVGGLVLNLNYQWKGLLLPKGLLIGHALTAAVGFVLLAIAAWSPLKV